MVVDVFDVDEPSGTKIVIEVNALSAPPTPLSAGPRTGRFCFRTLNLSSFLSSLTFDVSGNVLLSLFLLSMLIHGTVSTGDKS